MQNSAAINDPRANTIIINRQRWINITDPFMRSAIALHEVLSLNGLESTGSYPFSARLLALNGYKCTQTGCTKSAIMLEFIENNSHKNDGTCPYAGDFEGSEGAVKVFVICLPDPVDSKNQRAHIL